MSTSPCMQGLLSAALFGVILFVATVVRVEAGAVNATDNTTRSATNCQLQDLNATATTCADGNR